jgi:hypothetical protein
MRQDFEYDRKARLPGTVRRGGLVVNPEIDTHRLLPWQVAPQGLQLNDLGPRVLRFSEPRKVRRSNLKPRGSSPVQSNVFSEAWRKQDTEQYAAACVRNIYSPALPIHLARQQHNRFFDEEQSMPVGSPDVFQLPTVWVRDEFVL